MTLVFNRSERFLQLNEIRVDSGWTAFKIEERLVLERGSDLLEVEIPDASQMVSRK